MQNDGLPPPDGSWVQNAVILMTAVLTALGIRELWPKVWDTFANRKRAKLEDRKLSITTDNSLLDAATAVNKDYIALFKEVTNELKATLEELREHRRQLSLLEIRCNRLTGLIRRMLYVMKANGIEDYKYLEEEADRIIQP